MAQSYFEVGDAVYVIRGRQSFKGVVKSTETIHIREDEVGYEHATQRVTVEVVFTGMDGHEHTSKLAVPGSALRRRYA